jgi:hypothetical protein
MKTTEEMPIPKSGADVVFSTVITLIIIVFFALAVVNILNRAALIASCLWIAIVIMIVWSGRKEDGSLRTYLINRLGDVVGHHFAAVPQPECDSREVLFGFELLGHRFVRKSILIDKIVTVEWNTGQATDMAGRDMNDWRVCVWFDHGDPEKSEKQRKWHRKPDQDIFIVGPSARGAKTEALGLALVSLLRGAGAALMETEKATCFGRRKPETVEKRSIQQTKDSHGSR